MIETSSSKKGIVEFLHSLDEGSRAILCYLWWRRHAGISELRNLTGSADDFDVLFRLKEVINRKSQDLWGKPIVDFSQARIDPLTGEKVLFSWWYLDEEGLSEQATSTGLMDIFNEKDNVVLIAQLPSAVDLSAPDIQIKNGILTVKFRKIAPGQSLSRVATQPGRS
jgi:hypothetical protein